MNGVLVVDKPPGPTSHDVVSAVRRALRERRIGHTGTLDPFASGVLPLVIGKATRLASLLSGAEKEYEAGVRLGASTDTYDTTGIVRGDAAGRRAREVTWTAPPGVDAPAIAAVLDRFRGAFDQVPPPYSAKKIGGVAAYDLARQDRAPVLPPVTVRVSALVLAGYADGLATLRVRASAGFYVRALAHDIGAALGCGAHLEALRRTWAGPFGLADAVPLGSLVEGPQAAASRVIPMDAMLPELPGVRVTEGGLRRTAHGQALGPADLDGPAPAGAARVRLTDGSGRLLAIAEPRPGGLLQPAIVLV